MTDLAALSLIHGCGCDLTQLIVHFQTDYWLVISLRLLAVIGIVTTWRSVVIYRGHCAIDACHGLFRQIAGRWEAHLHIIAKRVCVILDTCTDHGCLRLRGHCCLELSSSQTLPRRVVLVGMRA